MGGGATSPPGASRPARCALCPVHPAGGDRRWYAPLPLSVAPRPGRSFHAVTSHAAAHALTLPAFLAPTLQAQPPHAGQPSLPLVARFAGGLARVASHSSLYSDH